MPNCAVMCSVNCIAVLLFFLGEILVARCLLQSLRPVVYALRLVQPLTN